MEIVITSTIIVAMIIGLAEAVKRATNINTKYIPLIDVFLGLALSFGYSFIEPMAVVNVVFYGIIYGLMACGLFSAGKNVLGGEKNV